MADIGLLISKISNITKREIDCKVSSLGISAQQGRIIGFLFKASKKCDVFQKDIEEHLDLRGASVTSILQNMEKHNLIKKESVSYDQRLKKIVLTEEAIAMNAKIRKIIADIEEKNFSCIESNEKELLEKTLIKVLEKLYEEV